ncbi:hypothetical protein QOZ80_4BG0350550 [Eleusine coracana subsp. coracana]|nr:hypothetical protein QOZ80_4BG0350550 [Eleusine coracana subsp. coracana]
MSPDQCKLIQDAGFGGLLSIRTSKLPLDLIYWLLTINFIHEKYQIDNAKAPTVKAIVTRLKDNKEPNEDYLRLSKLNWCQFVIESLKSSVLKMRKRSSVGGCLLLLVVLYLDSLAVNDLQIPSCNPRIAAWNKKLIDKIIKLDTNRGGGFGRLKFKQSAYTTIQESCFGRIEDIENFVSLRIKPGVSNEKKRKLCQLVNTVTVAISDVIGQFIGQVSELIDEKNHSNTSATASSHSPRLSKRTKYNRSFRHHPSASEDDEEEFEDGSDGDEEDEEEAATAKRTRSSSQSSPEDDPTKGYIINYIEFYVGLEHLSQSVIPKGELVSSVAEVAICNINYDTPKSARKIVMPLRIASFLQEGELDRVEMKRVFRRELNHLDRLHQVVFPVLQTWKVRGTNTQTGHYFLLCLNLRENRFEVLDSMRSLSDEGLINCCNIIILAIKELWYKYYPNSRKKI